MKVIYEKLPSRKKRCVVTIGVFDGIHLGHRFILKKTKADARKKGISSLVITFDISPRKFLDKILSLNNPKNPKPFGGYLTGKGEKIALIESLGIDYLWFLKTKKSLLELSAKDFMDYVFKYFEVKKLIVGEDFRFGHKGRGDLDYLKKLTKEYDFQLSVLKKKSKGKKIISSSAIRSLIKQGKLKQANKLLGRNFSLKAKVGKGKGLGRSLGFPTANLKFGGYVIPGQGVYAAYAVVHSVRDRISNGANRKVYLAVVNIGFQPTVNKHRNKAIEAHLINFNKNIIDKNIKIVFLEKIRKEKKFPSLQALRSAIQKDIDFVTAKYSASPANHTQLIVS